ncbi:fungal specific transcription factor domain-containing protein [Aspergillus mulundensis]|uniref:Xylanolytic transcriptional activator regulatory domain-containing protein n=1 Tax=Aspergillus mulundensis TaxID=1810919 RepID=A0A3D8R4H6_9EURO|nr:Uncharacterized protein DSM5745_08723 [Aspergillus mulundensis]RDW68963.1 Uncharacterized protein DSM5745_08723 [Aspergillus mulundensis]
MQAVASGREPASRRSTASNVTAPGRGVIGAIIVRRTAHIVAIALTTAGPKRNLIDRIRHIDQLRAESGLTDGPLIAEETQSARQSAEPGLLPGPIQLLPSPRIIHFAGWKIGDILPGRGAIPTLLPEGIQWIKSRTGTIVPFPNVQHVPWEKAKISPSLLHGEGRTSTRPLELPSKTVLNRYLDAYWASSVHSLFPVIESSLFGQTVNSAYSTGDSGAQDSSRACIFALLALTCGVDYPRARCTAPIPPIIPRDSFIFEAQRLLPSVISEGSNLDALQATVILAILGIMTGELQHATHYIAIASRYITAVGAHTMGDPFQMPQTVSSTSSDIRLKRHLRNLFWICYVVDKEVSLRTGQSHCLKDEDCNLQLPADYIPDLVPRMTYSLPWSDADAPLFPIEVQLCLIKSRIFSALYSYQGLQRSDAEIIRLIRELDDDLERWRLSMPPELRPTLTYGKDANKHPSAMTMYLVIMHLNYYFCINIVHLAGSRCESWRSSCSSPGMMDGLRSSLTISVGASRSLLIFLRDAESSISTGGFWALLFYTMSAVITLFCNLLENPTALTVSDDTRLLVMAEHTTERVFLRQISELDQAAHIQAITSFISRLRHIAQQAIQTARS